MQIRLIARSIVRPKGVKMGWAYLKVQSSDSLLTLLVTKGFIAGCFAVLFASHLMHSSFTRTAVTSVLAVMSN